MIIEYSAQDLLASKLVEPGCWYRVRITDVEEKLSADGGSTNIWLRGEILFHYKGDGTKSTEYAGVPAPFPWIFNSKGAWAMVGFEAALSGDAPKPGERREYNKSLVGREIEAIIGQGMYKDVTKNVFLGQYRKPRD